MKHKQTLAIVDYGRGNLHSVKSGFEKARDNLELDLDVLVTANVAEIEIADRVVLPGVGAMGDCFAQLQSSGLVEAVKHAFQHKPFFGICVGMQILLETGQENGGCKGLGYVPGQVVRFKPQENIKIPHIGWNQVEHGNHPLFAGIPDKARFYFVHSYHVALPVDQQHLAIAQCEYGSGFPAAIGANNWVATQFHPEKSHQWGIQLLQNFLLWQTV